MSKEEYSDFIKSEINRKINEANKLKASIEFLKKEYEKRIIVTNKVIDKAFHENNDMLYKYSIGTNSAQRRTLAELEELLK